MKKVVLMLGLLLATVTVQAASIVGVTSLAGTGVIGGTNSASLSVAGAGVVTGSQVAVGPNGAFGESATLSVAGGGNQSTSNASGGYLAGAIGGSGAGGFNSGNAVTGPVPVFFPIVP